MKVKSQRRRRNNSSVSRDIDVMIWSMRLCSIKRYLHQRFWETETQEAEYAARIEGEPRLESVAEHSWHVADTVLILANRFPELDVNRCLVLAILHDKLEIITGDWPAFSQSQSETTAVEKRRVEQDAIEKYLQQLPATARTEQRSALLEFIAAQTPEARFVKAVDKLQPLIYILMKKAGQIDLAHLVFTLDYSARAITYFPELEGHYQELKCRLIGTFARLLNISPVTAYLQLKSYRLPQVNERRRLMNR
jgi:5'-deoxynucleotidase YfbR-like HD superfamily hydrolase